MPGTMKKFFADRRGAFAMQFALLVVPLTVCTGLAIDGGRAFLARYELGSALDAAALAVGSTTNEKTNLNDMAHSFVNANFHTPHSGPIVLQLDTKSQGDDDIVLLKGTVTIDTYFMPLIGQPKITVAAESQVRRGGANVEVALALDITESMTMNVDRMTPLRTAAKDLINTVVTDTQTPFYSRVSIVPWGSAVHVGPNLAEALRGPIAGPVAISGATWRNGAARTIAGAGSTGWRKNPGGANLSTSSSWLTTWRNGTAKGISNITKEAQAVVTSNGHGLANNSTIYIYGVAGMTQINNKKYVVSDAATNTFKIKDPVTNAYINTSGYSTYTTSSNDFAQACFNSGCEVRITTAAANTFQAGDFVHLASVGSPYSGVNSAAGTSWTVSSLTAPTSTTFFLAGSNGPAISGTDVNGGSGGKASECFTSTCKFVVTAIGHGFSDGDFVNITGATVPTGGVSTGTSMNSSSGTSPWTVENATTDTFTLPGNGVSYRDNAGGTAQKCFTNTCEVRVTTDGPHGLLNGQFTQIQNVNGMTQLNQSGNTSWEVEGVDGNTFIVSGSNGPGYNDYTSGGGSQCLANGCAKFRYDGNTGSGVTWVIKPITDCVSERLGAQANTNAAPGSAPLGRYYPAGGYNVCGTANRVTPLTDNKEALRDAIDDLVVTGSTAGQVGLAMGWYTLSPDWGDIWKNYTSDVDDDYSKPVKYYAPALPDEPNTSQVLILMTDGEFNTAHCNGVAAQTALSLNHPVNGSPNLNDCDPNNGDSLTQARAICNAIDPLPDDPRMIVFTIGFEISATGDAADFLEECASKPEFFFLSENGTDLQQDFKEIAKEISKLRIAR